MPYVETPPPDLSGGFVVFTYTDGTHSHRGRLHVHPFTTAGVSSPYDYPYTAAAPAPGETGVIDTMNALFTELKPFFSAGWQMSLSALYQVVSGVASPVFPLPIVIPQNGTASAIPSGWMPEFGMIMSFRSTGGNKAKLVLFSDQVSPSNAVTNYTGSSSSPYGPLVGYLTGTATGIRAHDGTPFLSPAHTTWPVNRRLRRHYGHA